MKIFISMTGDPYCFECAKEKGNSQTNNQNAKLAQILGNKF